MEQNHQPAGWRSSLPAWRQTRQVLEIHIGQGQAEKFNGKKRSVTSSLNLGSANNGFLIYGLILILVQYILIIMLYVFFMLLLLYENCEPCYVSFSHLLLKLAYPRSLWPAYWYDQIFDLLKLLILIWVQSYSYSFYFNHITIYRKIQKI